jgi:hypothetical protein
MKTSEKGILELLETALRSSGRESGSMSEIVGAPARIFERPNQLEAYSFFGMDLTFRDDGAIILQEVNGSNAASTGMLDDGQRRRADHIVATALARGLPDSGVILLAHANKTGLLPEYFLRMKSVASALRAQGWNAKLRTAGDELGGEDVAVVIGPIDALVPHLLVKGRRLWYRQREIGLVCNCNIVPALVRAGKLSPNASEVDLDVFHEGAQGVAVALDKVAQQRLAKGSGITPLHCEECGTWEQGVAAIRRWNLSGTTVVAKIKQGSQGVGIGFFPPSQTEKIEHGVEEMRAGAVLSYGAAVDITALPMQLFEFAASTRYVLADAGHLWDVRIEAHVMPGRTVLIPNSMRICPAPFDASNFDLAGVVSNLSGRSHGLKFVRTPFAEHHRGVTELEWAGVDAAHFERAIDACANWCAAVHSRRAE